jgi:hypothetical protein
LERLDKAKIVVVSPRVKDFRDFQKYLVRAIVDRRAQLLFAGLSIRKKGFCDAGVRIVWWSGHGWCDTLAAGLARSLAGSGQEDGAGCRELLARKQLQSVR